VKVQTVQAERLILAGLCKWFDCDKDRDAHLIFTPPAG